MKKLSIIFSFFIFFNFNTIQVQAEGNNSLSKTDTISYDLEQGGTQTFTVTNDSFENYIITIEEEPSYFRSISNNTYKITKERALQWKVSYKIDVRSHAITRAHSPAITNYLGSVTSSNLKIDHAKQATYYIRMNLLTLNSSVNVRAKLLNNSIEVTY